MINRSILAIFALLFALAVGAQPKQRPVEVLVIPQKWDVSVAENIVFGVMILVEGVDCKDIEMSYQYGPEKMPVIKSDKMKYMGNKHMILAGSLKQPGFMNCKVSVEVDGNTYSGSANVGVSTENIVATTTIPDDFVAFWQSEKAKLKNIALEPKMTLLPQSQTGRSNVYHVSFQNNKVGSRIYGILSVPKGDGRYPAILNVPGAGVRPYAGDSYLSDDGFISLTIGIHGIPVNMEQEVYDVLFNAGLDRYWLQNLDDRDTYYYKRVYLGTVRAIDFIYTLPQFDGEFVAVSGGSQGGALAVITASLDPRVSCYTSFYPALCDFGAYLQGRAAGWPAMFNGEKATDSDVQKKLAVSRYFDVVNFARIVKSPGFFSWGYNDDVCPPTSMYAAYNAVVAPKELVLYRQSGHWNFPEQWVKKQAFIKDKLSKTK